MRAIKLLLVLPICAVPVIADILYDVTGAITIVGNNATFAKNFGAGEQS
jgi:hypothetical protein